MKHFDFHHFSYERLVYEYKKMKRQIKELRAENTTIRDYKNGQVDSLVSLYQQMDDLENLVAKLEKENPNNPNNPDTEPTLIDDIGELSPISDHTVSYGDGRTDYIASLYAVKGKCYTIQADVYNGNTFTLTQYPVSKSDSAKDNPSNDKCKLVKFVGTNHDTNKDMEIQLTFIPKKTGTLYIQPNLWTDVYAYKVFQIKLPSTKSSIPVPNVNDTKAKHEDKNTIHFLQNLIKELKAKSVTVPHIDYMQDENGNINYNFSAEPVQERYNFLDASNKLNQFNGIKRASDKKDRWIELSSTNDLVVKNSGDSQLYPYQPSSKDLRAKDWVVENVRPLNPDTKPNGSDYKYDNTTNSELYGWDGDEYSFLENNDD